MRPWKPEKQSAWVRKKFGLNILKMEEKKQEEKKPEEEKETEEKSDKE